MTDPRSGAGVAEELIILIRQANPMVARNPRAAILGLTTRDLHTRAEGAVWAWRNYRYDVVSSAMFGATLLGDTAAAGAARTRLRKMVAKNISRSVAAGIKVSVRPRGEPVLPSPRHRIRC